MRPYLTASLFLVKQLTQFHNQIGEVKDMLGDIIHTLGKRKKKKH